MDKKLKQAGFKKVYPDQSDKTNIFWIKHIRHPFLINLHIIVDEQAISVFCKECNNKVGELKNGRGDEFVIMFKPRKEKELDKIFELLGVTTKLKKSDK